MGKHHKTLCEVFASPTRANISWSRIESMLIHYGAIINEGSGSRVRIQLNGLRATFHRPHPEKEASKASVDSMRDFLETAGVLP